MPKKSKRYKHLSQKDRDLIAILKAEGQSLRAIARRLRRDAGTISRELKRNAPPVHTGYYLPHKAHARALERKRAGHRRLRLKTAATRAYVERMLNRGWSPELIGGRLRKTRRLPADHAPSIEDELHHYVAVIPSGESYYIVKLSSTRDVYLEYRELFVRFLRSFKPLGYR